MGLHCFPFILLELFMSLNACSDIKLFYIVFLSYFWNYSCPLMHAQILNGFTLFPFILLELFMSLNACSDIKWAYLVSFHTFGIIHVP